MYIRLGFYSISYFICYHVWTFICTVAVLSYYNNDYIACSGYFRLSVNTWGIFLAYIRHRLSSRLHFSRILGSSPWHGKQSATPSHNTCLNQCLYFVLKDIAPASKMMNHPMKKTIIGIICASNFIWTSSLWQLQLDVFVEQVEDYHHILIFEGILPLSFRYFHYQSIGIERFDRVRSLLLVLHLEVEDLNVLGDFSAISVYTFQV